MKPTKELIFSLIITLLLLITFNPTADTIVQTASEPFDTSSDIRNDYSTGIDIYNDTDIEIYSSEGNGSESFPYIIQNLYIFLNSYHMGVYIANTRSHCIIQNCTIIFGREGIHLWNASNVVLSKNIIDDCQKGLSLNNCSDISVVQNSLSNFLNGAIVIQDSPRTILEDNRIQESSPIGIRLRNSPSSLVDNNTLINSEEGIALYDCIGTILTNNVFVQGGITLHTTNYELDYYLSYVLENNTLNTKEIGFFKNQEDLEFKHSNYSQLIFVNCTNILISGLLFEDCVTPILAYYGKNFEIQSCDFFNNYAGSIIMFLNDNSIINNCDIQSSSYFPGGILLLGCHNCWVHHNNIVECERGIMFWDSAECNAEHNICQGNLEAGIVLDNAFKCEVTYNVINETKRSESYGILLESSNECSIEGNTVSKNKEYGIYLASSSTNVIISNSIVENENYGVIIDRSSSYNIIYQNEFIDNNLERNFFTVYSQAHDAGTNNEWFSADRQIGNFWSDRDRRDFYPIDGIAGSNDLYPLRKSPFKTSFVIPFLSIAFVLLVIVRFRKKRFQ